MNNTIKCEKCNGSGTRLVTGFVHYSSGCRAIHNEPFPCLGCKGTGIRTENQLFQERVGQYFKKRRIEMGLSTLEVAKILNMRPSEITDLEWGRSAL